MSANLVLLITGGVLIAAGVYLLLERSIMRILAGILLAGNGVNLLFLVAGGAAGEAPILGSDGTRSDPLQQAMVLTAIVISLAVAAFLVALSYRSFQLEGNDEVADDLEDAIVRRRADDDLTSEGFDDAIVEVADTEAGGVESQASEVEGLPHRLPDGSHDDGEDEGRTR